MRHQSRVPDTASELLGGESRQQVCGEVPHRWHHSLWCKYPTWGSLSPSYIQDVKHAYLKKKIFIYKYIYVWPPYAYLLTRSFTIIFRHWSNQRSQEDFLCKSCNYFRDYNLMIVKNYLEMINSDIFDNFLSLGNTTIYWFAFYWCISSACVAAHSYACVSVLSDNAALGKKRMKSLFIFLYLFCRVKCLCLIKFWNQMWPKSKFMKQQQNPS